MAPTWAGPGLLNLHGGIFNQRRLRNFLTRFFKRNILFFKKIYFIFSSWQNYRGKQGIMHNYFSFVAKYFIVQKFNRGI